MLQEAYKRNNHQSARPQIDKQTRTEREEYNVSHTIAPSPLLIHSLSPWFYHEYSFLLLLAANNAKNTMQKSVQHFSASAFAAATIAASSVLTQIPESAQANTLVMEQQQPQTSMTTASSLVLAKKEIRQGLYQEYEVDVPDQVYDDARSTFKSAKETKSKKGKYTALLAILIVGSFVIPMAQYFWYVRDDDSTDQFFGQKAQAPPEPEPKKKKWF